MTQIQEVIIAIFKEVKKICDLHDIPYFAIGGTCIGAVRHHGFIPWDDDLDIAIPIENYFDFLKIAREELPEHLYVYDPNDVHHNHYVWGKICDRRTAFIEDADKGYEDAYKGVFVDIMPISGIPVKSLKRELFYTRLKYYSLLNQHARFPEFMPTVNSKIFGSFLKLFRKPAFNKYTYKYLSLLKKYPFSSSQLTGYVWDSGSVRRLTFPKSWFEETIELQFEDTSIKCPANYDEYLTCQFGDYMTPPPGNKQQTHSGMVDLEHSFSAYLNKI